MDTQERPISIARGCLPVVLIGLLMVGGAFAFVAWRAGGVSKIESELLVNGSLKLLEGHALAQRPDGISETELRDTFAGARDAVTDGRADLDRLYSVLRDYEERFKGTKTKPSTGEMREFLTNLDGSLLPLPNVR
jgi:hypothetical protein